MSIRKKLANAQQIRIKKSGWITAIVSFFFLILILRLFYIQIVEAQRNINLSKENSMRLHFIDAPRGQIFDRNGNVLARNRLSYSICILPYKTDKDVDIITPLCKIRDNNNNQLFDKEELVANIKKSSYRPFDITRLKEDVPIEVVSIIEEHAMDLPGIIIRREARREYTLGDTCFHVLGYISEISQSNYESLSKKGYRYGDLIGKSGIESRYEDVLKGVDGREYVEVNAYGRNLGTIKDMPRTDPVPGKDIYLNMDARLQRVAFTSFPDTLKGAAVAINPKSGEVLAMLSKPSVNANIFSMSTSLRSAKWSAVAVNSNKPLNNRAVSGTYTPGSTFKPISAIAGLESGEIKPNGYMPSPCRGAYRFGTRIAHCWYLKGHGYLNVKDAIKYSCNIYFYQLGLKAGYETINKYANMLGLGQKTGIDLANEKTGWLSGKEAYNERFKKRGWKWTRGLVLDMAIGQQQILTPLQMALMIGGLGNGDYVYKPFVMKEMRNRDGIVISHNDREVLHTLDFNKENMEVLHDALKSVIEPGGTGWRSAVKGINVGGKTGSAENPQGDKTHALFVACAPIEDPVIAVSVVVENAGHGGSVAAPIAGDMLRYFFNETEEGKRLVEKYNE